MEAKTKLAVCKFYKLGRMEGKFSTEHKTVISERAVVNRDYMEMMNSQIMSTGRMYVEDKEESITFAENVKVQMTKQKEADAIQEEGTAVLLDAIASARKPRRNENRN